jgi:hypothetical protein
LACGDLIGQGREAVAAEIEEDFDVAPRRACVGLDARQQRHVSLDGRQLLLDVQHLLLLLLHHAQELRL